MLGAVETEFPHVKQKSSASGIRCISCLHNVTFSRDKRLRQDIKCEQRFFMFFPLLTSVMALRGNWEIYLRKPIHISHILYAKFIPNKTTSKYF